ncbi:hypothetical protein Tco_0897890 [Tanacetum coccineum]
MVISSPCLIDNKDLTSPEQTAPALATPKQTAIGSEGFHQVIDFLARSHICYALTKKPAVSVSFIKQFWRSAEASTDDNGEVKIIATIDGHSMTITEASLRRHLKLDDNDGITSLPNSEIFEQLALMGYHTDSDKLTFQKGAFSPQWRFLIHNILHCLSPKKTAWEQFSSNIATAVICLATNRKYNFSRMIFEHMVSNISSPHKFLMYPRFIQICLDMQRNQLQQHSRTYPVPSLSNKVFNNMKRPTKGYSGQEVALFPTMLGCFNDLPLSPSRIVNSRSKESSEKGRVKLVCGCKERFCSEEKFTIVSMLSAQSAQIARDEEIARQWDEEERQRAMYEAKTSKKIDWNDPLVISEIMKSPEKIKSTEKIEEEDVATQKEMKEVSKGSGAKRKKSIPRKSTSKRQKMEEDAEKEETQDF